MRGRKLKPLERQIAEGDPRKRGVHKLEENWKEQLEIMNLDYGAYALGLSAGSMAFQGLRQAHKAKTGFLAGKGRHPNFRAIWTMGLGG